MSLVVDLCGGLEEGGGEADRWAGAKVGDGARTGAGAGTDTVGSRDAGGDEIGAGAGAGEAEG